MNLKQLEYFTVAADTKSMSMAARHLYVAQPPISRAISLLEKELGVPLFIRTNKGVELTDAGLSLYRQAQELFRDIQRISDSVRDAGAGIQGQIKIGTVHSAVPIVMEKLRILREQYPQIEIFIRSGVPSELVEDLELGKLQVIFLRELPVEIQHMRTHVLSGDPLELIVPRDLDPAPDMSKIPIELLRGVPMCLLRRDDFWGYNEHLVGECKRHGFSLNIVCQCYDTPMAMQLVQAGFGLSYQPHSIVDTLRNPSVYAKPIKDFHIDSFPLIAWNNDAYLSVCVKIFLNLFGDIIPNTEPED